MDIKLVKNMRKKIILICSLVYFASYFSRKDFAIIMSDLLQKNIIDKQTGGLLCLALFICYGVGQIISGYLGDKLKPKLMITIGLVGAAICNLLLPLTSNPTLMILIWGINGLSQAMLWPPIIRILSTTLNNEDYVKANLLVTSAAHIATILLYIYIPLCLIYFTWQFVFISATVLALISCAVFLIGINSILPKNTTDAKNSTEIKAEPLNLLFKNTPLITIFIIIVAMGSLRDGIETWLPTLYQEAFQRSSSESILVSIILPIFSVLSITITTTFHKKSKLINNEILGSLIFFVLAAFISIILLMTININHFIARFVTLCLSALICSIMHGCNFLLISCLPGRFKTLGRSATASGFCNAFTYVGAALSTYGFALLSKNHGWNFTITSWLIIALIGVIFCFISKKKYTNFIHQ